MPRRNRHREYGNRQSRRAGTAPIRGLHEPAHVSAGHRTVHGRTAGLGARAVRIAARPTIARNSPESAHENRLHHPLRNRPVSARRLQAIRAELGPDHSALRRAAGRLFPAVARYQRHRLGPDRVRRSRRLRNLSGQAARRSRRAQELRVRAFQTLHPARRKKLRRSGGWRIRHRAGGVMSARALALWCCLVLASPAAIAASASAPAGLQRNVVFAAYSPLAGSAELMRRLMSPLEAMRLQRQLVQQHQALREQSIDLRRERFVIYVPTRAPPANGFALLVFVPPWKQAVVPQDWIPALDGSGTIFVSANDSGNDADVLDRREPLALLAAYNIMRRYRIDPQRVYVGGFSGGSKVALRLALAYPDLF